MSIPAGLPVFGTVRSQFNIYASTMFTNTSIAVPTVTQGVLPSNYWQFPTLDPSKGLEVWGKPRGVAVIGVGVGANDTGFTARIFGWVRAQRQDSLYEYIPTVEIATFDFQLSDQISNARILPGTTLYAADVVARITDVPSGFASMVACTAQAYTPATPNTVPGVAAVLGIPDFIDGITFAFDRDSHASAAAVTSANFLVAPIFGE